MTAILRLTFIISVSELMALFLFMFMSAIYNDVLMKWLFPVLIGIGLSIYLWFAIHKFSFNQILLLSISVAITYTAIYWLIGFLWKPELVKEITFLSRYHFEATLKLIAVLGIIHTIGLLIIWITKKIIGKKIKR